MQCRKCRAEIPDGSLYCLKCGTKQQDQARRPKTRGNGQGSIYKLPNGKWRAERTLGYEIVPGEERKRRIYVSRSDFTTKRDAVAYLPLLGTELDTRSTTKAARRARDADKTLTTLKQLYDIWLPTHNNRAKSTLNCYAAGFALFEECWNTPMRDMDIDDLQACLDDCGKGRRTQEDARTALGLVYKYGIPRGYVPSNASGQPNLAKFLRICDGVHRKKEGLTDLDLERLRAALPHDPYAGYILCNCYLGFRPTAFLALTVASYDASERAFTGGIKTVAGIDRVVTVSPKIQPLVDTYIGGRTEGPIFRDLSTGKDLSIKKYRAIFYDVLARCGIQPLSDPPHRLTPHSCRHTFGTMMKRVDAPDTDKLALIGHTDVEMLRRYQDVNYADLRRITDAL